VTFITCVFNRKRRGRKCQLGASEPPFDPESNQTLHSGVRL